MKRTRAGLLLAVALVGGTASAALASNADADADTGRVDCRHHETVCVNR